MAEQKPNTDGDTRATRSIRYKIGLILLVINVPVGITGVAFGAVMALKTGDQAFWSKFGITTYAISWAMLGLGVLQAGPEGSKRVKQLKNKWFRKNS